MGCYCSLCNYLISRIIIELSNSFQQFISRMSLITCAEKLESVKKNFSFPLNYNEFFSFCLSYFIGWHFSRQFCIKWWKEAFFSFLSHILEAFYYPVSLCLHSNESHSNICMVCFCFFPVFISYSQFTGVQISVELYNHVQDYPIGLCSNSWWAWDSIVLSL